MSTAVSGRILCPKCGANNFSTQAACWKCATPLSPAGAGPTPPAAGPVSAGAPSPVYAPAVARGAAMDPSVANWSGLALAVFFPAVAVPVGIMFLMFDDRRRAEVGRLTLIAGVISTIVHTVLTFLLLQSLLYNTLLPILVRQAQGRAAGGGAAGMELPGGMQGYPGLGRAPQISAPGMPGQVEDVPFPDAPGAQPAPR